MEIMTEIRVIQNTPFCWQDKKLLRTINYHFEASAISIASARSLYLALTEAASNRSKDSFIVTQGELASLAGLSRSTVNKLVSEFVEIGIIKIEARREGKINLPSIYTLLNSDECVTDGQPVKTNIETIGQLRRKEKKREKNKKNKLVEYSDDFNRFWKSFPKKTGKAAAWKAFGDIDPNAELLEKMIVTIEIFKTSPNWQKNDGQYIPMPTTWLNQERWYDELPEMPEPEEFDNTYVPGRKFE
jgi:hypothetical protein